MPADGSQQIPYDDRVDRDNGYREYTNLVQSRLDIAGCLGYGVVIRRLAVAYQRKST
jgi:hypothetical protein